MSKPYRARQSAPPARSAGRPSPAPTRNGIPFALYLSRAILVLAGFTLFLPLVVSYDFYEPFVFLKSILFRLAVGTMLLLYVVLAALSPVHRPRLHRITCALLAYFLVMIICSVPGVSVSPWSSWWGSFARMDGMFTQLHLLAYFFVLTQTLRTEREWLVLFTTSLFSGLLVGLSGMLQYLGLSFVYRPILESRIMGATGNANNFAFLMVLEFFIVLWFLSRRDRKEAYAFAAKIWLLNLILLDLFLVGWEVSALGHGPGVLSEGLGLIPIAGFVLMLHVVSLLWFLNRSSVKAGSVFFSLLAIWYLFWAYQSRTRFAVIGLVGSLVIFLFLYLFGGASGKMKLLAAASIAFVLLVPSIVFLHRNSAWVQNQPTLARLTTISYAAAAPRLLAWKAGALGVMDRPLLGWGPENYKSAFDLHFPPELFTAAVSEVWYDRAHNMIVETGTTTGLLGLAACSVFYGLVFAALLGMWFGGRNAMQGIVVAGLLLAYLIQNQFSFDTINTNGVVYLVLAYVAWLCGYERPAQESPPERQSALPPFRWQGWLATCLTGLTIAIGWWYLVKVPYESNLMLARAVASGRIRTPSGQPQYVLRGETVDLYRQASDCQTTGRHEVREQFANYASRLAHASNIALRERVSVVERAEGLLEESVKQEPSNARHYMYTASLMNGTLPVLQESDPTLARTLADRTLVLLQKAESLTPTRPQVYIERSKILAWEGRTAEAITALERAVSLSPWVKVLHADLARLYVSAGRLEDAARAQKDAE